MTSSVIITVVVVLGIVIAGGFLLYFMGDLFMSLAHKGKDEEAIRISQEKRTRALENRVNALENSERAKNDPDIKTVLYNGAVVEAYNPEAEETESTEEVEEQEVDSNVNDATEEVENTEENNEVQEETEEAQEEEDTSEYIKKRRQELMERLMKMRQSEEEEDASDTVDMTEETEDETTQDEQTETTDVEEVEEVEEQTETTEEQTDTTEEESVTSSEEVEENNDESSTEESTDDSVNNIITDEIVEQARAGEISLANTMSLDELEAKLKQEQDKLKANEKDLRQCKKEFIPLRRVKKTLESDEKKLRRKEALVAKQKVVLYGVNNYADIDEEKAKKLAEDLDLLDGLKLSVQHCEEVMSKNAERYPLLEKIFNLLSTQNAEIKENIKNIQEAIDSLNSDDNGDGNSEGSAE